MITRLFKRIERFGFFIFFFGMFLAAIGITQDVAILRTIGFAVLVLTILTVIVRARLDISRRPPRTQPSELTVAPSRPSPQGRSQERLPGRPGDPDTV